MAGFQGVRASPISAATVAMFGFLAPAGVSLPRLLAITIPSTLVAAIIGALSVAWRETRLSEDAVYLERLASGAVKPPQALTVLDGNTLLNAKGATLLFVAGLAGIVLIGVFPAWRPMYDVAAAEGIETDQVSMGTAIMIAMIAIAGLTMLGFGASPQAAVSDAQRHHRRHFDYRCLLARVVFLRGQPHGYRRRDFESRPGAPVDIRCSGCSTTASCGRGVTMVSAILIAVALSDMLL